MVWSEMTMSNFLCSVLVPVDPWTILPARTPRPFGDSNVLFYIATTCGLWFPFFLNDHTLDSVYSCPSRLFLWVSCFSRGPNPQAGCLDYHLQTCCTTINDYSMQIAETRGLCVLSISLLFTCQVHTKRKSMPIHYRRPSSTDIRDQGGTYCELDFEKTKRRIIGLESKP